MKFLIDVNASRTLGQWLSEMGHDVVYVNAHDPQMVDEDILNWALEEKRIIVTTNNDFEQIIWQGNHSHCGVLRLENLPRQERKILLQDT